MVAPTLDDGLVWTLVVLLGLGTFALRLSFIQLRGRVDEFPSVLERSLVFVPAAVLAALIFPALFTLNGTLGGVVNVRVLAAGVAAVVAWRTENMLATIGVGMVVLWLTTYLLG